MDPQKIKLSQLKVFQFIPNSKEDKFKELETLEQYQRNYFKDIHLITSLMIVLGEVERRGFPFKELKPSNIYTDGQICYIKEKDFVNQQLGDNDSFLSFNEFVQQYFHYHKFVGVKSFDEALLKIYNNEELTPEQEMEILWTVYGITSDQIDSAKLGYFNNNQLHYQFELYGKQISRYQVGQSIYKDIQKLEILNDVDSVCQMLSYIRIGNSMNIFTEKFDQNLVNLKGLQGELQTKFVEKLFQSLQQIHLKDISHENLCPQQIYLVDQESFTFKYQILKCRESNKPPNFNGSAKDDMWQMGLILFRYLHQSQQNIEITNHKYYNQDLLRKLDEIKNSINNRLFIPLTFGLLQYNKDIRCDHYNLCTQLRKIEEIKKEKLIQLPQQTSNQSNQFNRIQTTQIPIQKRQGSIQPIQKIQIPIVLQNQQAPPQINPQFMQTLPSTKITNQQVIIDQSNFQKFQMRMQTDSNNQSNYLKYLKIIGVNLINILAYEKCNVVNI